MRICITTLILVIAASVGFAHNQPLPTVSNQIKVDEKEISCLATIPTFAIKQLKDVDEDASGDDLKKYHDELAALLDKLCPVEVDGIRVKPVIKDLTVFSPAVRMPLDGIEPLTDPWIEAYVRYKYGLKGKPNQIKMSWNLYPQKAALESDTVRQEIDDLNEMIAKLKIFGFDGYISFVPDEPDYIWYGEDPLGPITELAVMGRMPIRFSLVSSGALLCLPLLFLIRNRVPRRAVLAMTIIVAAVGVSGRAVKRVEVTPFWGADKGPGESEAVRIFEVLHRNVYRAFDYTTEDDIYDALEQSVAGDLLTSIYKDVYHGNAEEEEGAVCQIDRVTILESRLEPDNAKQGEMPGFRMFCRWRAAGLVEHWGHVHRRVNEYSATYTVQAVEKKWKIVGVEMSGHKRILREKKR